MPLLNSEKPKTETKKNKTMVKKKQKAPSFDDKIFSDEPKIKQQKSEFLAAPSLSELQKQSQMARENFIRKEMEEK